MQWKEQMTPFGWYLFFFISKYTDDGASLLVFHIITIIMLDRSEEKHFSK